METVTEAATNNLQSMTISPEKASGQPSFTSNNMPTWLLPDFPIRWCSSQVQEKGQGQEEKEEEAALKKDPWPASCDISFQKYFFHRPPEIFRDVCEIVMTSSHSAEAMTAAPDLIQVNLPWRNNNRM